jgi:hypothetical protein
MQTAKEKIKITVNEYKRMFPLEYETFLTSTRKKADSTENDFAELKKSDMISRHLFDLPEILHYALQRQLTDEEYDWLYSRGAYTGRREGLAWFIKAFPQFKITKEW